MKKKILVTVLYGLCACAVLAALVLQCVAMTVSFSPDSHYFVRGAWLSQFLSGNPLAILAAVFSVLGVVLGIVTACLTPKLPASVSPFGFGLGASIPSAVGFALVGLLLPFDGIGNPILRIATAVVCLTSAVYCVLCALPAFRARHADRIALLGFCAPIACALLNVHYYFDLQMEMNAPIKTLVQAPLLLAMLYYIGELRFLIDRQKPRALIAAAICTASMSALCAPAYCLAYLVGTMDDGGYVLGAILALGISVTAILRAVSLLKDLTHPVPAPLDNDTEQEEQQAV